MRTMWVAVVLVVAVVAAATAVDATAPNSIDFRSASLLVRRATRGARSRN